MTRRSGQARWHLNFADRGNALSLVVAFSLAVFGVCAVREKAQIWAETVNIGLHIVCAWIKVSAWSWWRDFALNSYCPWTSSLEVIIKEAECG